MPKPTIEQKRSAICKHRGGWEKASDEQIEACWETLPESLRAEYLKATTESKKESKNDDNEHGSGSEDGADRSSRRSRRSA